MTKYLQGFYNMHSPSLGIHILAEFYDCDRKTINDIKLVEQAMNTAAKESGATIISSNFHKFIPHGVSGVIIIAESHLTIHSWPEYNYAAIDIFTCGETINSNKALISLQKDFKTTKVSIKKISRGSSL